MYVFRSTTEAKDFSSSLCVQTISEVRPASYPMVTGGLFPGLKCGRGMTLTIHPHVVPLAPAWFGTALLFVIRISSHSNV
jgi:hypothetical protein